MKKDKELENLLDEVLNKKSSRTFSTLDAKSYLNYSKTETKKQESSPSFTELSTEAMLETLKKQNEDLKQMSKQNMGFTEEDYQKLEKEIQSDFGISMIQNNEKVSLVNLKEVKNAFEGLEDTLNSEILGQKEYIHQLVKAFKRPFVLEKKEGMPLNSMMITGPQGTGKHESIKAIVSSLHHRNCLNSDDVIVMDLSLYSSKDQESIFYQDLYMNLTSACEVLCFENAQKCFSVFLEVLSDLVSTGKTQLTKRYISNNQGQLIESQNGLVKSAISTMSAEGKYLIFISEGKADSITQVFGTSFIHSLNDRLATSPLNSASIAEILNRFTMECIDRCASLEIKLTVDDLWRAWALEQFRVIEGAESLKDLFDETYQTIAEIRLEELDQEDIQAVLTYEVEPILIIDEKNYRLSDYQNKETVDDLIQVKKELEEIIGLDEIKKYVYSLEDHVKVQALRKKQGLKTSGLNMHMIFTGNPGTGKTTIARLISRLLKAIGVLSSGQLVEVTRADLVGKYVGHTAPLTTQVMKSALGGVLFIDEAYSLYRGKDDSFGLEAIDTLVKGMEDNREDLVVILAGYSKEMKAFLESNSGLKSRFPNLIEFPDYSSEELIKIAQNIAKSKEYRIDEAALENLRNYFERVQNDDSKTSGNGRLARNVIEEAILNQSSRLIKDSNQSMDLLILEDFDLS